MTAALDVTTNPDAQEAESRKYWANRILRLDSGAYAVWDNRAKLIYVGPNPLEVDLSFKKPVTYPIPVRAPIKIDLKALGFLE